MYYVGITWWPIQTYNNNYGSCYDSVCVGEVDRYLPVLVHAQTLPGSPSLTNNTKSHKEDKIVMYSRGAWGLLS